MVRIRLSVKIFLLTFAVLMSTFVVSFSVIENLLPRLYQREFFTEFDQLIIELEREIRGIEFYEIEGEGMFSLDSDNQGVVSFPPVVADIVTYYAITYNMSITVWEIEPVTAWLGEIIYEIDGRKASIHQEESQAVHGNLVVSPGQMNFYTYEAGGFAISAQGTFQPAERVLAIITSLQSQVLIVMFFVSLAISMLYSFYLARPIVRLSHESEKLRKLEFDEGLKINRRDEIGDLSSNLNFMSFELKNALDDLQKANKKLKEEMEREREQERQRRNLFTSISHELKTPITVLKGEIGGMIDKVGVYKDRDVYLGSAYGWTETLEKLVAEILTIARLEGENMRLDFTHINISELLTEVCKTYQTLADNQNITVYTDLNTELIIRADESQIKIAISNIISNAIFYTKFGEAVDIRFEKIDEFAVLTVINRGAFIAEDDLINIFEPFYRIDKSRSRHTGGSGLGLFIVKNIFDLHGFEYGIENVEAGVRFMVKMPIFSDI